MDSLHLFASGESGIHISLKAEELIHLGPLKITNSMVFGFLMALLLLGLITSHAKKIKFNKTKTKGAAALEALVEFVVTTLEGPLKSRQMAIKFMPYFATYFMFILLNNTMGLLPFVGPGLTYNGAPILRAFTADLNGTIAMAIIGILMVQYLSIKIQGGKNHLQHYFTNKPWNPINLFIGILEVLVNLPELLA